jgi:16S rRNA (guanine527-N7)-methyltransferase
LFDSLNKRIVFLQELCKNLELKDVKAVHGRAEEFGIKPDYRQQYDIATARAVARMPVLLEICLPFVKKGGILIALKGPELENELKESENALKELGGKVIAVQEFTLADGAYTRNLAVIEKVKDTPKKYPRKAGTPQKKPL